MAKLQSSGMRGAFWLAAAVPPGPVLAPSRPKNRTATSVRPTAIEAAALASWPDRVDVDCFYLGEFEGERAQADHRRRDELCLLVGRARQAGAGGGA